MSPTVASALSTTSLASAMLAAAASPVARGEGPTAGIQGQVALALLDRQLEQSRHLVDVLA
ncbi:MAG TPA: hypothetical protein VD931_12400 [Baekduia sp.]|nr:hypothetical protein [Baekduia sp.]